MKPTRTEHGFRHGALQVDCLISDDKKGWVVVGLKTPRADLQVYVTKTGKVRINARGGKEWKPQ